MNDAGPRYALYFAPDPAGELWRFGSGCIGYDAATGGTCEAPRMQGFTPDAWAALTEEPRRYGFHATLKAPFHLASSAGEAELFAAVDSFASSRQAFALSGLRVALLSRFVALAPAAPSDALQYLAAHAVEALEPWRAPLGESDVARRLQSPLSDRQRENLRRWGYPYVFDEFRFHMTLTGALDEAVQGRALAALTALYQEQVGEGPVAIDSVALFRQERRDAPFRIIRRAPLRAPNSA